MSFSPCEDPFGIAQAWESFRNEITTKNFIFRSCEFEQMEMQFFCKPGTDDEDGSPYWREERMNYLQEDGYSSRAPQMAPAWTG